jgi:putative endonuclease
MCYVPSPSKTSQPVVYILRCADGSLYVGWTSDLDRRVRQHQTSRASKYTRSRLPVQVAACFAVSDRTEARRLEARLKALPRARKLELLASIEGSDASIM